jgi:hypothetical protein
MVPVEAAVNSSMLLTIHCSMERLSRLVWRVSCAIRRASVSWCNAINDVCRCTIRPSVRYLAAILPSR